ncbi:MAG: ABC-three component system protein [Myxococcota bacterium]
MDVSALEWENLFAQWGAALVGTAAATDNEGAVEDFAADLLRLLGWDKANRAWKEKLELRVGSKYHDLYPDLVLAASKADTKKPGSVYAVIELKRRGLADEDARAQAQSYADPLHAPVYAVIDGERIRVWHRRLVEADKRELDLPRAEFHTRFDEVRALLGREQLTKLHEDLRTRDEVDEARKRVANIDHSVELLRLELRDGKVWCDHPPAAFLAAQRWWGSPVSRDRAVAPVRLEIIGKHDDWMLGAPGLVEALARLKMHAPTTQLAVEEPALWQANLDEISLNLERHHATEVRAEAASRQAPAVAQEDLGDPVVLASALAAALDTWVVQAVKIATAEALRTGPWSAVAAKLDTPPVEAAWLRSTLRASRSDAVHAKQRLGRRTVTYLVDALLFSKAVSLVLETLDACAQPDFPHNLDGPGTVAREGIGFTYALAEVDGLKAEAYLLLLSGSSRTHLPDPRRIGDPPRELNEPLRKVWRIGDQKGQHRILCSLSDDARGSLAAGWETFQQHLVREIRAQNALIDPEGATCPTPPSQPSAPPSAEPGAAAPAPS